MGHSLVEIHPRELQFTFEVKKQSSCSVHLVNKSNEYVAFKVTLTMNLSVSYYYFESGYALKHQMGISDSADYFVC
ncbi:hypothetical protein GUJ93_ZPchr0007g5348 [Zizania palustris]|uniref:MSP domain-containing protein n=1 Tax=Zizania palustris TaxID=103762 RepID=A0A8J5SN37_ZIZPA|nr:hypothetical protein GUJ93_ZPchr0007g5348 [Zizania palustris]